MIVQNRPEKWNFKAKLSAAGEEQQVGMTLSRGVPELQFDTLPIDQDGGRLERCSCGRGVWRLNGSVFKAAKYFLFPNVAVANQEHLHEA